MHRFSRVCFPALLICVVAACDSSDDSEPNANTAGSAGSGGSSNTGGSGQSGSGGSSANAGSAGSSGSSGASGSSGFSGSSGSSGTGASSGSGGSGGSVTNPCADVLYPESPNGATTLIYVSGSCGNDSTADGSQNKPFQSVVAAVATASENTTLLVEAGTYTGRVILDKNGLQLIGGPPNGSADDAAIIFQNPGDSYPLVVRDSTGVLVRGVAINGALTTAVGVESADATFEGCAFENTTKDSMGEFGHNMFVAAGDQPSHVTLVNSRLSGAEAVGIIFQNSSGLIDASEISNNADVGVWLYSAGETTIQNSTIRANKGSGILAAGSRAIIFQNEILDTQTGSWGGGDGIIATDAQDENGMTVDADVEISGNLKIAGNARTGILINGNTRAIIFQNPSIDTNLRAGIWLQNGGASTGALIDIHDNALTKNSWSGFVALNSIVATVSNNTVDQTQLVTNIVNGSSVDEGDGFCVFDGAQITLDGNTATANGRAGVFIDSAAAGTLVTNNTVNGNDRAIIFQNDANNLAADATGNQIDGSIESYANAPYGVTKDSLAGVSP